jgi:hypothetical protein
MERLLDHHLHERFFLLIRKPAADVLHGHAFAARGWTRSPIEPRQSDRHTVLAELPLFADRAGAGVIETFAISGQRGAIGPRPRDLCSHGPPVLHEITDRAVSSVVLTALERLRTGHTPERGGVEQTFQGGVIRRRSRSRTRHGEIIRD